MGHQIVRFLLLLQSPFLINLYLSPFPFSGTVFTTKHQRQPGETRLEHLGKCASVYKCGTSQMVLVLKKPTCQCRRLKRHGFDPWVRKIPWRRVWQLTPVFLPGESPWTEKPSRLQSKGVTKSRTEGLILSLSFKCRTRCPVSHKIQWKTSGKQILQHEAPSAVVESLTWSLRSNLP